MVHLRTKAEADDDFNDAAESRPDLHIEHDPDEIPEPQTRKQLFEYYSGKGPAAMIFEFHEDTELRRLMMVIPFIGKPIQEAYAVELKLMESVKGQLLFCANRASMHASTNIALEIFHRAWKDELYARLGMTMGGLTSQQAEPDGDYLQADRKLICTIHKFACNLAMETLWTQMRYHFCLPHALAVYLIPEQEHRKKQCLHLTMLVEAILKAEAVEEPGHALKSCLNDCSFHREQLPRIIMQHCYNHDGLGADDQSMRSLAWKLFAASSSTKETLESCFNYMQRQGKCMFPGVHVIVCLNGVFNRMDNVVQRFCWHLMSLLKA